MKPCSPGLMLRCVALCPKQWKIGLVRCFLHRAFSICGSWELFHNEIKRLTRLFGINGYPRPIVSRITRLISFCVKSWINDRVCKLLSLRTMTYFGLLSGRVIRADGRSEEAEGIAHSANPWHTRWPQERGCCSGWPVGLACSVIFRTVCREDVGSPSIPKVSGKHRRELG